jgi:hypothetical protein
MPATAGPAIRESIQLKAMFLAMVLLFFTRGEDHAETSGVKKNQEKDKSDETNSGGLWRVAGVFPGEKIREEQLLRGLVPDSFRASLFRHTAGRDRGVDVVPAILNLTGVPEIQAHLVKHVRAITLGEKRLNGGFE